MNTNRENRFILYPSRLLEAMLAIAVSTGDANFLFTQLGCVIPCHQHEGMRPIPTRENSNPVPEIARHDRQSAKPFVEITKSTMTSSDTLQ